MHNNVTMGRKPPPDNKKLKYPVSARISDEKNRELKKITEPHYPMSDLIRRILENRRIKIFTHDPAIDPVLDEIALIRKKLKLTGQLINDSTKSFHSRPKLQVKQFYAKMAFDQYGSIKPEIERLLEIVKEMAKRWLDENSIEQLALSDTPIN
jgi:hypothetical protein